MEESERRLARTGLRFRRCPLLALPWQACVRAFAPRCASPQRCSARGRGVAAAALMCLRAAGLRGVLRTLFRAAIAPLRSCVVGAPLARGRQGLRGARPVDLPAVALEALARAPPRRTGPAAASIVWLVVCAVSVVDGWGEGGGARLQGAWAPRAARSPASLKANSATPSGGDWKPGEETSRAALLALREVRGRDGAVAVRAVLAPADGGQADWRRQVPPLPVKELHRKFYAYLQVRRTRLPYPFGRAHAPDLPQQLHLVILKRTPELFKEFETLRATVFRRLV